MISFNLLRPIQSALFNDPDVSNYQNSKKHEHLDEAKQSQLLIKDGPGKQKNGFDVEDDKQDCNHVITDRIPLARIGVRIDAAFVRHQLACPATVGTNQLSHQQSHDRKQEGKRHEQEN